MRHVRALLLATLLALPSCTGAVDRAPGPPDPAAVVVASFDFSESALLAEIYAVALESAGVPVRREPRLGTREMVSPALHQGLVDVVPEYLGSAAAALGAGPTEDRDAAAARRSLESALTPWAVRVLASSAAQNQNGFAVTRATAERLGLSALSELARVSAGLTLTGPAECPERPLCLPGLQEAYGARFAAFTPYATEQQRLDALVQGVADVAVVFTTDGRLAASDLVVLADDRGLQPAENVTPLVSERAVRRFGPRVVQVLDAVSRALDTATLRFLNWRVDVGGRQVGQEARAWLLRHPEVTSGRSP